MYQNAAYTEAKILFLWKSIKAHAKSEFGKKCGVMEPATQSSHLLSLGPEILSTIAKHLKPRHLYKLMQTSKYVKKTVDTEDYWERAAIHIIFRHFSEVELDTRYVTGPNFPKLSGLLNLVNLEFGYYKTINLIIERVRFVMQNDEEEENNWKELANSPLSVMVRAGEARVICESDDDIIELYKAQPANTMKDVVYREILFQRSTVRDRYCGGKIQREFLNDIDDMNFISRAHKAKIMERVSNFISDMECTPQCINEEVHRYRPLAEMTFQLHQF